MPLGPLHDDPRFRALRTALPDPTSGALEASAPPVEAGGGRSTGWEAAVSLVLRGGDEIELLLIRRARREGDPWSGQMALPGGRREPGDASLLETAVRETKEEVGVDLVTGPDEVSLGLGRLPTVASRGIRVPSVVIHPFVFGVPPVVRAAPASVEVAAVRWVPLPDLVATPEAERARLRIGGEARSVPCFRVGEEEVVWGLTHRILRRFLDRLPEPFGP